MSLGSQMLSNNRLSQIRAVPDVPDFYAVSKVDQVQHSSVYHVVFTLRLQRTGSRQRLGVLTISFSSSGVRKRWSKPPTSTSRLKLIF